MKALGWLLLLSILVPAHAGTSGSLFLRAYVPARTQVRVDPIRGTFTLHTNVGKYALTTWVTEGRNERGFRIITIIPQ